MNTFKEALVKTIKHTLFTAVLYLLIYLVYTFTVWEFKNPFQWIIDLSKYQDVDRFMIISAWILYHLILIVLNNSTPKANK